MDEKPWGEMTAEEVWKVRATRELKGLRDEIIRLKTAERVLISTIEEGQKTLARLKDANALMNEKVIKMATERTNLIMMAEELRVEIREVRAELVAARRENAELRMLWGLTTFPDKPSVAGREGGSDTK